MPQQLLNIRDVLANQAAWDADVQFNNVALKAALRTLEMTIAFQGSTIAPSTINIQLQDANGVDLAEQFFLRVRVVDNNGYAPATNATIAQAGGTALVETVTAGKDLVFKSDAAGLVELQVTDAVIETFQVLVAQAPVQPVYANHNNSLAVAHA